MSSETSPDTGSETSPDTGDQSQKSYREILAQEIEEGLHEMERPNSGLALSALSAGLDIGFGPLLMAVVLSHSGGGSSALFQQIVVSSAYAIGFMFVILGQSDLFTEHTVLAILPVLDGRASAADLGRIWGIIYGANLLGGGIFVALTFVVAPGLDVVHPGAFTEIANILVGYPWWMTFVAAILAGWLMGLLSWLVVAARDTTGTIIVIWFVAGAIGFAHLPHCIAGSVEVLFGVLGSPAIDLVDYFGFLLWSTLGNVIGGVVFVGLLKYSHVTRSGEEPGAVELAE